MKDSERSLVVIFLLCATMLIVAIAYVNIQSQVKAESKPERFFGWQIDNMPGFTDGLTGCQYARGSGQSSWTYLHGTCTDVIAKENGK